MAERIDTFKARTGRPAIYPWEQWLDGSAWRIRKGVDFQIPVTSMAAIIRQRAEREGMWATCRRVQDEAIEFQVYSVEAAA